MTVNKIGNRKKTSKSEETLQAKSGLSLRGRSFVGTVISARMQKTVTVKWERKHFLKKYERYEKRKSRISAHSPSCISAKKGNFVKIAECRPLAKTKHFVVIEKVG